MARLTGLVCVDAECGKCRQCVAIITIKLCKKRLEALLIDCREVSQISVAKAYFREVSRRQ